MDINWFNASLNYTKIISIEFIILNKHILKIELLSDKELLEHVHIVPINTNATFRY